jgi:hypothetical protein
VDALDRVAAASVDLLARVDRAIAETGAAPDHPVWPLVRRLRALPGTAVGAVAALRPGPLAGAGSVLGPLADGYADTGRTAARGVNWTGVAADRFVASAGALATHLTGSGHPDRPGLAGRAHATAEFADAMVDWMGDTRAAVAHTLATALGSAQAVALRTAEEPSAATATAAADIAARVLDTVAQAYDTAEALCDRWTGRLAEEEYRPPAADGPPTAPGAAVGG